MRFSQMTFALVFLLSSCATKSAPPPATPTADSTSTASPSPMPTLTPAPSDWCSSKSNSDFLIIGYLPDYRDLNPEWGKCLTDIIYFSAKPLADGTLDTSNLSQAAFDALQEMKNKYGTRVLISIGGWERSDGFATMVSSAKTRKRFIDALLTFSLNHKLDGADFDWEFPENETQLNNYISLLTEVKAAFTPHNSIVSVALSADIKTDFSRFAVVDRIHVMSYDRGPLHSTYNQAVEDMNTFAISGLQKNKLILGVPFYGRKTSAPFTAYTYQEIMTSYKPSAAQDQVDGIYFNGITTIQDKTCFVRDQGYGGIMIWELGQDTRDETSLLRAIQQAAADGCAR